jgi:hypothetical protein
MVLSEKIQGNRGATQSTQMHENPLLVGSCRWRPESRSRGAGMLPEACQQSAQLRGILTGQALDLHAKPTTVKNIPDDGLRTNVSLLHKEMQTYYIAFAPPCACFQEKPGRAQVCNSGNVAIREGLPIHPHIVQSGDTRGSPAAGAGRDLRNAHRLYPRPSGSETGQRFSQTVRDESTNIQACLRKITENSR